MYCNNCISTIRQKEAVWCFNCKVPLHIGCANKCTKCGNYLCDTCFKENKYICDECATKSQINVIRRSYLETYNSCPHQLMLILEKGIMPEMHPTAQLGVVVHDIIDKAEKGKIKWEDADTILDFEIEDWNKSASEYSQVSEELIERGHTCLNNYFAMKDLFLGEGESEVATKFKLRDDLADVSCTIDRVAIHEGEVHIHDWKTGTPLSGKRLVEDLQPPCYIYSVYKKYGKIPKTFNLHYLQNSKTITYNLVDEESLIYEVKTAKNTYELSVLEVINTEVIDILEKIKAKKFAIPSASKVSWRCKNMCWFKEAGHCKGIDVVGWRNG